MAAPHLLARITSLLAACLLLGTGPALAQVQALKQLPSGVVLGTDKFSLTVENSGTLRSIKLGEITLLPFVAIYSNPTSTDDEAKPVRCCQAESPGLGDRPPQMETSFADGRATLVITRDCSHPKVYDNAPIWTLRETVVVQPGGLIKITYHCRFLRFLTKMSWTAVLAAAMPEFTGRSWRARVPDMMLGGTVPADLPKRGGLEGAWELQLESSQGTLYYSFANAGRLELNDWGQYLQVGASLPDMPHTGPVYRDVEQELTVSLQLPVVP